MGKVEVVLLDDIDGGHPAQTVSFSWDGKAHEIDLTEPNTARMRDARERRHRAVPSPR